MTELPNDWKCSTIGEVAEIVRGVTYSKGDTLSATDIDAVPLLRATNLEVDSIDFNDMVYVPKRVVKPQQVLQVNDVFMAASSGSISVVGKSAQVVKTNGETFGAFCSVIRPKNVHPKFLAYWVQSPEIRDHWSATAKGTNINNLKPSDISGTYIPIPPMKDQQKIVELLEDHLSRLDAALAEVKQAKVKAAQFRRSLLQAAFTGNLTGDGAGLMTTPKHWEISPLSKLVDVLDNLRVPVNSSERNKRPGSVPYYGATGQVGTIDEALFNEELLILGEDGVQFFDPNKPKAYKISGPAWVNNHAHVLRPKSEKVLQNFLLHFLNQFNYIGYANGTTRLKLTQGAMNSIPVHLPTLPEQQKIVEIIEDHLSRLDASVAIADAMEKQSFSLRRSLLQAAFSGQLTKEVASV